MASPRDNRPQSMAGASIDNVNMRYNTPIIQWWEARILHDTGCTQQYLWSYAGSPSMWISVPTKPMVFQIIGPMFTGNSTLPQPSPATNHGTEAGHDALARHPKRSLPGAQYPANEQNCGPHDNTGTRPGVRDPTGPDNQVTKKPRVGSISSARRFMRGKRRPVPGANVTDPDASLGQFPETIQIYEDATAGRGITSEDAAGDSALGGGRNVNSGGRGGRLQHRTGLQRDT